MKKNNSWFSIIFAMWYLVILSMIVIVLHEYLVPFSKNVKGIENSSNAYYQSLSWIEQALYEKKSLDIWWEKSDVSSGTKIKYSYKITASWSELPPVWKWNSDFDKDWNKIWIWEPIQLKLINKNINWSDVNFYFRVPDLDWDWNPETLENIWTDDKIINWQFSGSWYVINSNTWSMITVDNINTNGFITILDWKDWIIIWANIEREKITDQNKQPTINFKNFAEWTPNSIDNYSANPTITPCSSTTCNLKMSLINKLIIKDLNWDEQEIPYLEYKIDFTSAFNWTTTSVPTRLSRIKADWFSNWFKKTLNVKIPQQTSSEAFDFTVFQ